MAKNGEILVFMEADDSAFCQGNNWWEGIQMPRILLS